MVSIGSRSVIKQTAVDLEVFLVIEKRVMPQQGVGAVYLPTSVFQVFEFSEGGFRSSQAQIMVGDDSALHRDQRPHP